MSIAVKVRFPDVPGVDGMKPSGLGRLARGGNFCYTADSQDGTVTDPVSDSTRVKADIVPYTAEYSTAVRSWIDSAETYASVCRGTVYPPPDDVVDSWQRPGVTAYLLFSEGKPVAYGELWDRKIERAVEIVHLIVDQYKRGRGYGSKMLELLYSRAASRRGVTKVLLNLNPGSEEVLGCCLKAKFELIGAGAISEGLQMMRSVGIRE